MRHVHLPTCAGFETVMCDLASCHALYFIVSSNLHSSSSVPAESTVPVLILGNVHVWGH